MTSGYRSIAPSRLPAFGHFFSKTRARLRARGVREVAAATRGTIRSALFSDGELIFLTRSAAWSGEVTRRTAEPLQVVKATVGDGNDYERFIGTDSAQTFARRLSERTSCWLVRGRGIVLHATWTTTRAAWTRELKRSFVAPPGSAYIYESFTRPEARGLGLYPFALVEIGRALALDAVERLFVGVEGDNAPSQRAILKAGFEPAFTITIHRRLGRVRLEPSGPQPDLAARCFQPPVT